MRMVYHFNNVKMNRRHPSIFDPMGEKMSIYFIHKIACILLLWCRKRSLPGHASLQLISLRYSLFKSEKKRELHRALHWLCTKKVVFYNVFLLLQITLRWGRGEFRACYLHRNSSSLVSQSNFELQIDIFDWTVFVSSCGVCIKHCMKNHNTLQIFKYGRII